MHSARDYATQAQNYTWRTQDLKRDYDQKQDQLKQALLGVHDKYYGSRSSHGAIPIFLTRTPEKRIS